jgi:AcrR family transcriptional regulator
MVSDLPPSQRYRTLDVNRAQRRRILDATVEVVVTSGYDIENVHVRDVALVAKMSTATIYKQFPSKVDLMIGVLNREVVRFEDYMRERVDGDVGPHAGFQVMISGLIDAMELAERVTEALSKAFTVAAYLAPVKAEVVRDKACEMVARFAGLGTEIESHRAVASAIVDVLASETRAVVQGRATYADMRSRMTTVVDLVAGPAAIVR